MIGAQLALRGQLFRRESAQMGGRLFIDDFRRAGWPRERVLGFDQQPGIGALALARADAHEMPAALEARTFQRELQVALVDAAVRIAAGRPGAAAPPDDAPAA